MAAPLTVSPDTRTAGPSQFWNQMQMLLLCVKLQRWSTCLWTLQRRCQAAPSPAGSSLNRVLANLWDCTVHRRTVAEDQAPVSAHCPASSVSDKSAISDSIKCTIYRGLHNDHVKAMQILTRMLRFQPRRKFNYKHSKKNIINWGHFIPKPRMQH